MLKYFLRKAGIKKIPEEQLTEDEEEELQESIKKAIVDSPSKVSARKDFIGFAKGDEKEDNVEVDTDASRDEDSYIYLRPAVNIDSDFE